MYQQKAQGIIKVVFDIWEISIYYISFLVKGYMNGDQGETSANLALSKLQKDTYQHL